MRNFRNCFEFVPYVRNYFNLAQSDREIVGHTELCSDTSCFLHGIIEQLVPACVPGTSAGREVRHTGERKKVYKPRSSSPPACTAIERRRAGTSFSFHFVAGESALTDREICYYIVVKNFKQFLNY